MSAPEVHCESLGATFKGVETSEKVLQFRGIKFASIPRRFARSELVTSYEGGVVDATAHGFVTFLPTFFPLDTRAKRFIEYWPADQTHMAAKPPPA
jgi:hypothetical protein